MLGVYGEFYMIIGLFNIEKVTNVRKKLDCSLFITT